jgi:peptide/nickel transport system substrate-binding protein
MWFAGIDRTRRTRRSAPTSGALCLLFGAASAFLPACTAQPSQSSGVQTLRLAARATVDTPTVLARFLFAEHLITIDWTGRPQPSLATAWEWRKGGQELVVQLRHGVTFHDGTPLTAQGVAEILRKFKVRDSRNLQAVTRFDAVDAHTLAIQLERPDAFLVETIAETLIVDPEKPDVGTGPFRILTRTPTIVTERNQSYYRGTPGIDKVEVITYDTQRAAWVALMRGEVDMLQDVNRDAAEFLEGASRVEMSSTIRPYYIPLVFNVRHPVLKRVEVRRALSEAINREEIVREAMRGRGRVADDPVWPFHWAYNAAARKYSYNPNAARLRMDAAGMRMRPSQAPGKMESRFSIRCIFWSDPLFERIALLLQRQLADVGVDLILEDIDERTLRTRVGNGDFDAFLFQMASGKSFDWTYRFWHSPRDGLLYQDSGYTGVDAVLDRLRLVRPDAEVRTAVADLRERFYEDVPAAFLAWPETTRAIDSRFDTGDRSDPDLFAKLWKWRLAERQEASR